VTGKRRRPRIGPFPTKTQAEAEARRLEARVANGDPVVDRNLTVAAYIDEWLAGKARLKHSTREEYRQVVDLYIKPGIGHLKLVALREHHLDELYAAMRQINNLPEGQRPGEMLRRLLAVRRRATWLRDGEDEPGLWQRRRISPSRIRRVHAVIQSALSTAVKRRIITRNPAEHIELPPVPPRKPLVWTQARIAAWRRTGRRPAPVMIWPPEIAGEFLDRCEEDGERLIALYHLAVTRGLRRGDLWGLLWENVELDLAAGIGSIAIREDESTSYADEVDPEELISVKSAAGWRTIALDSQNVTLLARWRRQQAAERLAAGDAWEESGRVFTTPIGTPLRKDFIGDHFEVLVKRYGLPPIRFHDLRHCSASYMLASGADPKTVAATLGHGRASFTLDVYGSSLEELEQATAEAAVALIPRRHRVSGP